MNVIKIRGLEISACHGVHGFEKEKPQTFIFDADLTTDFYSAAISDNIKDTVSYSDVCALISDITVSNVFNLIEKLAYECAFGILEKFEKITAVTLTVHKPQAPLKCKFQSVAVTVSVEREVAYLSIGSSIGDRESTLNTAVEKLGQTRGITVEKVSDFIKTAPYGGVAQNEFLNGAVKISTFLTPHVLLDEIHRIEAECGRVRDKHWGDRTLDIDIVFFGNKEISDENLTIPHPDYMNRDFVKIPLKQIAPHLVK